MALPIVIILRPFRAGVNVSSVVRAAGLQILRSEGIVAGVDLAYTNKNNKHIERDNQTKSPERA
jgi:hypothetical protein